jgi:DeoR/GlpR family transcriptional regulator of sugar metabolism
MSHTLAVGRAVSEEIVLMPVIKAFTCLRPHISHIRADIFFMGVTGIHPDHGLTTGDREEAAIKRAISRQSAETIVLASKEKLGAVSAYDIVGVDEIDGLIVEKSCSNDLLKPYQTSGISITRAQA